MQSSARRRFIILSVCGWLLASCAVHGPSRAPELNRSSSYTVRSGDTLVSIARSVGLPSVFLQHHNKIVDPTRLPVGRRLSIPSRPPDYIWPLGHIDISSGFRSPRRNHQGVDLRAPAATPIHAIARGIVEFAGTQSGFGNVVIIEHASGIRSLYGHTANNLVSTGDRVHQGQVIARVGRSGNATGFHLHLELQQAGASRDPYDYLPN